MQHDEPLIDPIQRSLARRTDLHLAILFGSATGPHFANDSDIDIAIVPLTSAWTLDAELALESDLSIVLGREVDLVRLDNASSLLRWEVIRNGVRVFGTPESFKGLQAKIALEWAEFQPQYRRASRTYLERLAKRAPPL